MGLIRHCLLKRLTEKNEVPGEAVRPFDVEASGTAIGEGGGLLILEEYERAKARGAKIYAELVGFAASQDTHKITEPCPTGHSYAKAIQKALADANLPPAAVSLIVPNGLGIASHDRAELTGLIAAFGGGLERIAFAPIKGQMGNMAAGSGVDAATAVLAVEKNVVPGAVNTKKVSHPLNVFASARQQKIDVALSTVYSLGGQNAALVFKRI
jgi:3-oxoacyl-[acyl-carrier-protein] synthase II